jgi:hypothetical protein
VSAITAIDRRFEVPSQAVWERLRRIDPVELVVLSSFVLLGMWVLGPDLYVYARGGAWTGTDGIYMADQLQYLAWIRDASQHFLASNMFVLRPTPHDYLQPMIAISGGLVALGMAPWLALLLWKPVALAVVLIGIRRIVHRTVTGVGARRAALVVALFAGTNAMFIDLWLPMWAWGYPFALVALGAALLSVLRYERARADARLPFAAACLAALAGWLHPWQGEVLILSLVGAEAVMWSLGHRPHLRSLALTVGAAALPLGYYAALHHFDPSWRLAAEADDGGLSLPQIASWLWPLAIPALLAYRLRPRHLADAVVRVWPVAAVTCYAVNLHGVGNSPFHAFLGITVPLAILAAQGLKSIRWPRGAPRVALALLAVAAVTVPVTIHKLDRTSRLALPGPNQANFLRDAEADALAYVSEQPGPGGVLTDSHLGVAVPAETGRRTYIGDKYWSQPDFGQKQRLVDYLLLGWMRPQQARAFVLSTGARFLIDDCWAYTNLAQLLGPIIQSTHQFDCARVYTIRQRPRSGHPSPV